MGAAAGTTHVADAVVGDNSIFSAEVCSPQRPANSRRHSSSNGGRPARRQPPSDEKIVRDGRPTDVWLVGNYHCTYIRASEWHRSEQC